MKAKIECRWINNMAFEAEVDNHSIKMDADELSGGENLGPKPKALLLVSLAGCTGMDVVSILKKMRVDIEDFYITVEGDLANEHPKFFEKIKIFYHFKGKNLPMDKIQKAVELSQGNYCGVAETLRKGTELEHEIIIEE